MQYSRAGSPRFRLLFLISLLLLALARLSSATTWNVSAGQSLQAALDSAQPGDTILVQAGATFVVRRVLDTNGVEGIVADFDTVRITP
jgi:nitrous oxidase accessory protein NosD